MENLPQAGNFREKINQFLQWMDEKSWFRMAVCMMPGIIGGQLAMKLALGETAGMVCMGLIVAGGFIFAKWHALRARLQADYDEKHPQDADYPAEVIEEMGILIHLYDGGNEKAEKAVMEEKESNPSLSTREAIAVATSRYRAQLKRDRASLAAGNAAE